MVDKQSPVPIYFQLEEMIKKQIDDESLKSGELIPSEREYADMYGISRMTVRQAITNLVNEGRLYRQKGKGTFVGEKKIEKQLRGIISFTEEMKSRGLKPGTRLVHFETRPADEKVASRLAVNIGDPVYQIERVRLADGVPMAFETAYLSANVVEGLTAEGAKGSLYEFVKSKLNLTISTATQQLVASVARESESELLEIQEGMPVLLIIRTSHLQDGTPLEYVHSVFRGDRYTFIVES
jgi:GntR family transcriptional regulator